MTRMTKIHMCRKNTWMHKYKSTIVLTNVRLKTNLAAAIKLTAKNIVVMFESDLSFDYHVIKVAPFHFLRFRQSYFRFHLVQYSSLTLLFTCLSGKASSHLNRKKNKRSHNPDFIDFALASS